MTEQQIPVLSARLVEHQRAFLCLTNEEAQWVIQNATTAIELFVVALKARQDNSAAPAPAAPKAKTSLLERLGTVSVGPTMERFVAKERLVRDTSPAARVKIRYISNNVADWWLAGEGLIEEPIAECELVYDRLRKASVDGLIITELGGVTGVRVSWTEVYGAMARQPNGPKDGSGALRTDGWWNIFYVPQVVTKLKGNAFSYVNRAGRITEEMSNADYLFDEDGQWYVLRAVFVCWHDCGWRVYASSVESSYGWVEGRGVFSRSSRVLESSDTVVSA